MLMKYCKDFIYRAAFFAAGIKLPIRICTGSTRALCRKPASRPASCKIRCICMENPWGSGRLAVPTPQSTAAASWTNFSVTAALRSSIPASSEAEHSAISRWMLPTKLWPKLLARAAAATITSAASCEYRKSSPPGSGDCYQGSEKINGGF